MARFDIDYTIKGRVSISAKTEEEAYDVFMEMDGSKLDTDDKEVTQIEKADGYDD